MAFWGARIPENESYVLQLNYDHNRVRITQATIADYTGPHCTSAHVKLSCAVGNETPIYICALSNDLPFCNLDLEFEESQEVVFSIRGNQGIHLSGYYVPSATVKKHVNEDTDWILKTAKVDCAVPINTTTLANGMIMEDLEMGKPRGRKAMHGRKVKIYYEVRLRDTNELVTSNTSTSNTSTFYLGSEGAIEGVNIGITGMREGGRRRLTMPHSLCCGNQHFDSLPPDSWVVYDVKLLSANIVKKIASEAQDTESEDTSSS